MTQVKFLKGHPSEDSLATRLTKSSLRRSPQQIGPIFLNDFTSYRNPIDWTNLRSVIPNTSTEFSAGTSARFSAGFVSNLSRLIKQDKASGIPRFLGMTGKEAVP